MHKGYVNAQGWFLFLSKQNQQTNDSMPKFLCKPMFIFKYAENKELELFHLVAKNFLSASYEGDEGSVCFMKFSINFAYSMKLCNFCIN
jgi:hypothetical protein